MYRYQPPKAAVWGHSLRKMKPARERELIREFLRIAVAEYGIGMGSLSISAMEPAESALETVKHFERILGVESFNGFFPKLTEKQIDACWEALVSDEQLYAGRHVNLLEPIGIAKWLIDGKESATRSTITVYYGSFPVMSTSLGFESLEAFRSIRDVLQTLKLCRLNDKHLKRATPASRAGRRRAR